MYELGKLGLYGTTNLSLFLPHNTSHVKITVKNVETNSNIKYLVIFAQRENIGNITCNLNKEALNKGNVS